MIMDNCEAHPNIDGLRSIKHVSASQYHQPPTAMWLVNSFSEASQQSSSCQKVSRLIKDKVSTNPDEPTSSETFNISVLEAKTL